MKLLRPLALSILAGCAIAPEPPRGIFLEPVSQARRPDGTTVDATQAGWHKGDHDSSWLLLDLAVANRTHGTCLLSPDSLDAVLVSAPDRVYPSYTTTSRPRDFRDHHAMLVEQARRPHDPANPYHPDGLGLLVDKMLDVPDYKVHEAEYREAKWNEAQWDRKHGGQVDVGDPALVEWRRRGMRDTLVHPDREVRMLVAFPADTCDGRLTIRLRFCGEPDSMVLRQRRVGL